MVKKICFVIFEENKERDKNGKTAKHLYILDFDSGKKRCKSDGYLIYLYHITKKGYKYNVLQGECLWGILYSTEISKKIQIKSHLKK